VQSGASSTLTLLRSEGFEVYLKGTSHVSKKSEAAVREVIRAVQPAVVVVELCDLRAQALRSRGPQPASFQMPFKEPFMQRIADALAELTFANGRDMLAALEAADAIKARVVCGDLPQGAIVDGLKQSVTNLPGGVMGLMARAQMAPPPPPGLQDMLAEVQAQVMRAMRGDAGTKGSSAEGLQGLAENFKKRETLRQLRGWVGGVHPELMHALVGVRDEHLCAQLLKLASAMKSVKGSGQRGVCVVGIAHMDGIEALWATKFGAASVQPIDHEEH
jgi:pheromone shutdown protein TraB